MSPYFREPRSAPGGSAIPGTGSSDLGVPRPRSRMPGRLVVGALSAVLLVAIGDRIVPAIRAGLHDGTRGFWVATTERCARSACTWNGKFVTTSGHVMLSSAQFYGRLPTGIRPGSSVAGLFPGGSGVVFPATGSDLWMSLLAALVVAALGLYWSSHRLVRNYLRQRRSTAD